MSATPSPTSLYKPFSPCGLNFLVSQPLLLSPDCETVTSVSGPDLVCQACPREPSKDFINLEHKQHLQPRKRCVLVPASGQPLPMTKMSQPGEKHTPCDSCELSERKMRHSHVPWIALSAVSTRDHPIASGWTIAIPSKANPPTMTAGGVVA